MLPDSNSPTWNVLSPGDLVRDVKQLPSAPKVLPPLKHLLGDGNSAMHEIVALIRFDVGIAARVLQTANSAYYSKGVRCYTIDEAVNRVGYDQIYELVSYAVVSQVLTQSLEAYRVEAEDLWRLSVTCALAAEVIATHTKQDHHAAYTTGLLHCVGMVAINEWALQGGRSVQFTRGPFPREAIDSERAVLGFTQADAGSALLRQWGFPATVFEPLRCQYSPRSSVGHTPMSTVIHAAKWLRSAVCFPSQDVPLPEASMLQVINLKPEALRDMTGEVETRMHDVSSLLEMGKTGSPPSHAFPSWAVNG